MLLSLTRSKISACFIIFRVLSSGLVVERMDGTIKAQRFTLIRICMMLRQIKGSHVTCVSPPANQNPPNNKKHRKWAQSQKPIHIRFKREDHFCLDRPLIKIGPPLIKYNALIQNGPRNNKIPQEFLTKEPMPMPCRHPPSI